jgi:hypothetical protein
MYYSIHHSITVFTQARGKNFFIISHLKNDGSIHIRIILCLGNYGMNFNV